MPKRSPNRITKRFVDAARARAAALVCDEVLFDRDLPGFGVRVRPSGITTYVVQYRDAHGRSRRVSLGRHGPLTCEEARGLALAALGRVAKGENPADERKGAPSTAMTIAELGDLYFAQAGAGRVRGKHGTPKKASTLRIDRYRWREYVVPLIGRRFARELERRDVVAFLSAAETRARKAGRSGAGERRLKGMLGGVMAHAVEQGVIEANPCLGIKTRPDGRRRIALDGAQYRALGGALARAASAGEPWQAVEALRLIALTGCRRGEVVGLRWSEVDLKGQALRLADSKTGANVRPLGKGACAQLRRIRGLSGTMSFVFPAAPDAERTYAGLGRASRRIIGRTVVTQDGAALTPHGLRHAFAGVAAGELNYAEPTIAALIGHAATNVTSRYIHHLDSALIAAADAVSERIGGWLDEGVALASHEAREKAALKAHETHTGTICVIADFHPKVDKRIETLLKHDILTKALPADVQAALTASLGHALARFEAGLPHQRQRGAKPQARALDILMSDVEQAFADVGLGEFITIRFDGVKDAPVHAFAARLLVAAGMGVDQKSLAHNARRARSIERLSLPPTAYKPPR